jgi:hypothetical protein
MLIQKPKGALRKRLPIKPPYVSIRERDRELSASDAVDLKIAYAALRNLSGKGVVMAKNGEILGIGQGKSEKAAMASLNSMLKKRHGGLPEDYSIAATSFFPDGVAGELAGLGVGTLMTIEKLENDATREQNFLDSWLQRFQQRTVYRILVLPLDVTKGGRSL